jgi:hypothetical protein
MSLGLATTYLLSVNEEHWEIPNFGQRVDLPLMLI